MKQDEVLQEGDSTGQLERALDLWQPRRIVGYPDLADGSLLYQPATRTLYASIGDAIRLEQRHVAHVEVRLRPRAGDRTSVNRLRREHMTRRDERPAKS